MAAVQLDVGDGWTLLVPAEFHVEVNPDGSAAGWDDHRTVDVHIIGTEGAGGHPIPAFVMLGLPGHDHHQYRRAEGWLEGYADLSQEADEKGPFFRLATTTAVENRLISCWCAFRDRAELDWALTLWRSIVNHDVPQELEAASG